jgi:TonB family protein
MNYLFPSRISVSTTIGIIASVAAHGALFAFPNLPLFSVEQKPIQTNPIPVIALNEAELARLPDLTPQLLPQVPEFPNTPLPTTPLLETAIQLPFLNTPPPPPLEGSSLFLPSDPVDELNIKPQDTELPPISNLPNIQTITPPPPPTPDTSQTPTTPPPAITMRDDLEELQRQLALQREIETEINIDLDSLPKRTTEDILREFSNPSLNQNQTPENNNNRENTSDSTNPRGWPAQLLPVETPTQDEIYSLLSSTRDNTRAEIQQRMAALKLDTANTSDEEANNNYLNWLLSINQLEPENISIKGQYPKDACLQKLEGSTTYGVMVNAQGEATNLQLIKSSGYPIFNQNARHEISFHNFPKNVAKPYLVKVDFTYNENRCPEQLPPANQNNRSSVENTPPSSSSGNNNTEVEEKKPESTTGMEEKKSDVTVETQEEQSESKPEIEEKQPDSTDETESKPEIEEKQPDSTDETESKPEIEEKQPDSTDETEE